MKRFSIRYVIALLGIFMQVFTGLAHAQTDGTADNVRYKVLSCLYRSVGAVNVRNAQLQELQKGIDSMQPLAPQSLDSIHLASNLVRVGKYLRFLVSLRAQLQNNLHILTDSIHLLEKLMTKEEEKKSLGDFLAAYTEESSAFKNYSQWLSLMITEIRKAIAFLQTVPMTRTGNEVTFNTDRSANEKYLDFETRISSWQNKVDMAIEKTIQSSAKENKAIQQAVKIFNR